MATISSRNAVQASWPEHNTLGVPHPTRRSDSGTQGIGESEKSSRLVILAGPGGVGTIRLELELGPAPKRLAGVGDVWLWSSLRAGRRDHRGEYAPRLQHGGCGLTDVLRGSVADRDMLLVWTTASRSLDACAEPCGFPAENNG